MPIVAKTAPKNVPELWIFVSEAAGRIDSMPSLVEILVHRATSWWWDNAHARTQVETAMAHLNPAQQQTVAQGERIVGSVAIDGEDPGEHPAHLRWFTLDEGCRGSGMGRRLPGEAVAFCDRQGFDTCERWTFKGLDAARKLHESFGQVRVMEEVGDQWGRRVTEQRFSRKRGGAGSIVGGLKGDDDGRRPVRRFRRFEQFRLAARLRLRPERRGPGEPELDAGRHRRPDLRAEGHAGRAGIGAGHGLKSRRGARSHRRAPCVT